MNKKKLVFVFIVISIFLALGGVYYWGYFITPASSVKLEENKLLEKKPASSKYAEEGAEEKINNESLSVIEKIKSASTKSKKLTAFSDLVMMQDVNFHAHVVDQKGNPVKNAKVEFSAGNAPLSEGAGTGYTTTDAAGRFSITQAKAYNLRIVSIQKSGYDTKKTERWFRGYDDPNFETWNDYSTPETAYVFEAWKVEKYPKVFTGTREIWIFEQNKSYSLDFLGEKGNRQLTDSEQGDLSVVFDIVGEDWTFTLSGINGGIQETHDEYMNFAPKDDFQPVLETSGTGQQTIRKNFYFTSQNEKVYGAVQMEVRPFYSRTKNNSALFMTYVINLEGGRNLAVKP